MGLLGNKLGSGNQPETETTEKCPVCEASESILLWWGIDRLYQLPGRFGLLECVNCGLVRLSPRPTVKAIAEYYPADYGAYVVPEFSIDTVGAGDSLGLRNAVRNSVLSDLGYERVPLRLWQKILRPILRRLYYKQATYGYGDVFPRFTRNGRVLEVGCGNGAFLSYLKHHGWEVQGVDLSPFAADQAKKLFGIDVFVGELDEVPFDFESFDYVHLSHVVEHFFDPLSALQKIYDLMKPGATVYIEVPNAESIAAKLSGEYWYGWDVPRHLFTFSPSNLELVLKRSGLEVVKTKTVLANYFRWADTFELEEESGVKLSIRPLNEECEKSRNNWKIASRHYSDDPMVGDFISCWARKPLR